ncbi:MAG: sulfite exporter TauE/SafE family protein [Ilumatobacteraceae bacterium]
MHPVLLLMAALATSAVGTLGGLGGAIILVPVLVSTGMSPTEVAPLGLLSVVVGSSAAANRQMRAHTTHHRLGVVTESASTAGAVVGALAAGIISQDALTLVLAGVALFAALAGGRRKGMRWKPDDEAPPEVVGEWIGTMDGAYSLDGAVVPYRTSRVGAGLVAMGVSGIITGLSGVGGGFIKTPAKSELMRVPVKVSSSTTTFSIGITAASALLVKIAHGDLDVELGAAVVIGSLVGGQVGALVQSKLSPPVIRRFLSVALIAVAVTLVVRVL